MDVAALAVALVMVTADHGRSSRAAGTSAVTGTSGANIAEAPVDRPRAAATETVRSASRGTGAAVMPSAALVAVRRGGENWVALAIT